MTLLTIESLNEKLAPYNLAVEERAYGYVIYHDFTYFYEKHCGGQLFVNLFPEYLSTILQARKITLATGTLMELASMIEKHSLDEIMTSWTNLLENEAHISFENDKFSVIRHRLISKSSNTPFVYTVRYFDYYKEAEEYAKELINTIKEMREE